MPFINFLKDLFNKTIGDEDSTPYKPTKQEDNIKKTKDLTTIEEKNTEKIK